MSKWLALTNSPLARNSTTACAPRQPKCVQVAKAVNRQGSPWEVTAGISPLSTLDEPSSRTGSTPTNVHPQYRSHHR